MNRSALPMIQATWPNPMPVAGAGRGRRDDPGHHRQNDQPEDVVDHRRAEDDLRLFRLDLSDVFENPGGNADRRGGQGRTDEHVHERIGVRQKPPADSPAEEERNYHADSSDQERGDPDSHHFLDRGLQADLEQKNNHPDLGENFQSYIVFERLEGVDSDQMQVADYHAQDQFAQDGRLSDTLEEVAPQFGGQQDHDQSEQNLHNRAAVAGVRLTGRSVGGAEHHRISRQGQNDGQDDQGSFFGQQSQSRLLGASRSSTRG